MSDVFSVAVRHADGSKNLYHMDNPDNLSPEDLLKVVRNELPESRVILCTVNPIVPTLKQVH
jgi:hypothetical protein